jgi:hypothetical protein
MHNGYTTDHRSGVNVHKETNDMLEHYFADMEYPVVSRICLPQIEHKPFLKAHPIWGSEKEMRHEYGKTHHGSTWPRSVL